MFFISNEYIDLSKSYNRKTLLGYELDLIDRVHKYLDELFSRNN